MVRVTFSILLSLSISTAMAQNLVSGSGITVSLQDLESDLLRVPNEVRSNTFSRPVEVHNNISNLYVRRVLASEAIQSGADTNPVVKAALELARDRVLSEARLAQIDKANQGSEEALLAYALTSYKANTKRFEVPEQVKIKHIMIRLSEPNARIEAEKLLKELQAGADFEQLAKTSSQDTGSAIKGGDLGLIRRGRMVKPFEDAAFNLAQPGSLSDVVETQFGFHIIKLEEHRPAGIQSFEEVKASMINEARATLVNNARVKERDRILSTAKFDDSAIEAFAKAQAK